MRIQRATPSLEQHHNNWKKKEKKVFITKWKEKLWQQGNLPLTTIKMEVLFLLAFHNLQGLHHNNWKEKEKKGFITIVIENALKIISVLRRNYFK